MAQGHSQSTWGFLCLHIEASHFSATQAVRWPRLHWTGRWDLPVLRSFTWHSDQLCTCQNQHHYCSLLSDSVPHFHNIRLGKDKMATDPLDSNCQVDFSEADSAVLLCHTSQVTSFPKLCVIWKKKKVGQFSISFLLPANFKGFCPEIVSTGDEARPEMGQGATASIVTLSFLLLLWPTGKCLCLTNTCLWKHVSLHCVINPGIVSPTKCNSQAEAKRSSSNWPPAFS